MLKHDSYIKGFAKTDSVKNNIKFLDWDLDLKVMYWGGDGTR